MKGKVVEMQKKQEDKVEKESQEVVKETESNTPHKLSYEQLASAAQQLSDQGRQLFMRNQELEKMLEEANLNNVYKKLDYLWSVINSDTIYLTEDFKFSCGQEFMNLLQGGPEEGQDTTSSDSKTEE